MSRRVRLIRSRVSPRRTGPNAGAWQVDVVAEVDGERRRVNRSARSEAAGHDKVRAILEELAAEPVTVEEPRPAATVADVAEHYLTRTLPLSGVAPSTRELYESTVRRDVLPALGSFPVAELTAGDVEDLLARFAGLSATTRKRVLDVTRYVLDVAVRDRLVASNVARSVRRPRQDPPKPKAYGPGDLEALLDEVQGDRLEPLWTLMAWTGLRIGEALGLADADVHADGDEPRLWVRGSLRRTKANGLTLGPGKSAKAPRWVPLSPEAVAAVRRWRAARAAEQLAAGPFWIGSDYLFTTAAGGPIDSRNAARKYRARAKEAEVGGSPHVLRHTFATDLVRDGAPVRQVQELLGHASPVITLATYSKVTTEDRRDAIDRLGRARRSS